MLFASSFVCLTVFLLGRHILELGGNNAIIGEKFCLHMVCAQSQLNVNTCCGERCIFLPHNVFLDAGEYNCFYIPYFTAVYFS